MSPQDRERLARSRFALLTILRGMGVIVMLIGLAVWYGPWVEDGDRYGSIVFVFGLVQSLVLPPLLVRRWRGPDA